MSNFYRHPHLPIVQAGAHRLRLPLCLMLLLSLLLQPAASPVQAQIGATRGTAIIGVSAFSAPFASQSTNGQMVGFDLELMKTLVRTAGLRVSYEAVPFRELIPGVATQLYDAAAGCIFVTEAWKALVDFTVPYFTTGTILLFSDATAPLYTVTDLTAEMRVAVSSGSTAERFLREQTAVQVVEALEQQAALDLLVRGAAEAALIDETVAVRFLRSNPDTRLKMMGGLITTDECAFAVSKANPRLRLELNAALTRRKNNGQFLTIYRRWFGSRPLTGPRPTSRPTPSIAAAQGALPAAVSTMSALDTPLIDNALGAYVVTLLTDPLAYQLIELAPEGRWLESLGSPDTDGLRGVQSLDTGQLPVRVGKWQVTHIDPLALTIQISATVPLSIPLASSAVTSTVSESEVATIQPYQEYELTVQENGTVHGAYTLYQSALLTGTLLLTETIEMVGQRVVQ